MQPTLSPSTMETRREKKSSGDSFSFPSTPNQDSDFEFGCITPDSPSSDPCRTSPADQLFFNGRLLPHSFPFQQQSPAVIYDYSRTTSRTSSIGSKDSLLSSRSNSTNSRSSSCSSARTSSSDSSERRLFYNRLAGKASAAGRDRYQISSAQTYGCSQRWQYITPVPALNRDTSRRTKGEQMKKEVAETKKQKTTVNSRFGWRFLRWFVMACKECHAMEPSSVEKVLKENVKIS